MALTVARPAATALFESMSVASAQNGPLKEYAPTNTAQSMQIVGTSEPLSEVPNKPKPINSIGITVCQRRSPRRSERRPQYTISTEETAYGTEFSKPICITVRPNDLSN